MASRTQKPEVRKRTPPKPASGSADHTIIMTTSEVGELLHLRRRAIYRLIEEGTLHSFKVGHLWRFSREEIEDLVKRFHKRP
jgi:excisionase family DNA binding protein